MGMGEGFRFHGRSVVSSLLLLLLLRRLLHPLDHLSLVRTMCTQDLMVLLADKITKHPETKNVGSVLVVLSCIFSFVAGHFVSLFHFAAFMYITMMFFYSRLLKIFHGGIIICYSSFQSSFIVAVQR